MKGVILYTSKYGSAKKYAQWLSDATGFDVLETKKAGISELSGYDTVIFGGGVYAGSIAGLGFLKKNIGALKDKRLAIYCCGAAPFDEELFSQLKAHSLKGGLEDIPCFYCRGAFDLKSLSFGDKTICKLLIKAVSKKAPDELTVLEKALLEAKDEPFDRADKKYLEPMIGFINK